MTDYYSLLNEVIDHTAIKLSGGLVTVDVGMRDMVLTVQRSDGSLWTAFRSQPEAEPWSLVACEHVLGAIDADRLSLWTLRCDREALWAHVNHVKAIDAVEAMLEGARA